MQLRVSESFLRTARRAALIQARRFGLGDDNAEECAQSFVVKWLVQPMDPPIWTWPTARVRAYLQRAAYNHTVNFRRDILDSDRIASHVPIDAIEVSGADVDSSPWAHCLHRLFWERVRAGLDGLGDRQRRLFIRHHLECAPIKELASESGRSPHAVEQSLLCTRKQLRRLLAARGSTAAELDSYLSPPSLTPAALPRSYRESRAAEERM